MKGIFISYRREDTAGFARSLFQNLESHFGPDRVFMDVEAIELGMDFVEALDRSLASCRVLLVLIGKDWASSEDDSGARRLMDPNDFVRMEVASALQRTDVRVIPVLVRGAVMPRTEDLPEDLQALTRRQAFELRHDRWNADVQDLIQGVEKLVGQPEPAPPPAPQRVADSPAQPVTVAPAVATPSRTGGHGLKLAAAAGGLAVILGLFGLLYQEEPPPTASAVPNPVARAPLPGQERPGQETPGVEMPGVETPASADQPARPPVQPAVSRPAQEAGVELVLAAQDLLGMLGYEPGPVDGVMGAQTARAVRNFQRDHGLAVDGRITQEVVDHMHQAYASRAAAPATPAPRTGGGAKVAGIWLDEDGIRYHIMQQGPIIQIEAYDAWGTLVGGGEGRLNGRQFDYALVTLDGMQYSGQSTLSANGQRIDYRSVNLMTGERVSGSLYRQ